MEKALQFSTMFIVDLSVLEMFCKALFTLQRQNLSDILQHVRIWYPTLPTTCMARYMATNKQS